MSQPGSPWLLDVGEEDFQREVVARSQERPVVVDFWAAWCGPCRMLGPILEQLVAERNGEVVLAKVDIDRAPGLAAHYGIDAIPAVKAFRAGRPVLEFTGLLPEPQLRAFLDQIMPTPADRAADQAAAAEATNPVEAETLYRQALELDRNQETAAIGLARLLLGQGKEGEAAELLGRIDPGSPQAAEAERLTALLELHRLGREHGSEAVLRRRVEAEPANAETRYRLGCALAAAGQYPEALDLLLSAAERDRKLGAAAVREAMLKVFQVIGARSELADRYRDRLARLLY